MGATKRARREVVDAAARRPARHGSSPCASATCSAAPAPWCRSSRSRSTRGGPVTVTRSRDDPLLHDDPRGRRSSSAGGGHRRRRRHLRAGHGRAGADRRPGPRHDPALGRARDATSRSSSPGCGPARSSTRSCSTSTRTYARPDMAGSGVRPARVWTPLRCAWGSNSSKRGLPMATPTDALTYCGGH